VNSGPGSERVAPVNFCRPVLRNEEILAGLVNTPFRVAGI